jgi:hypothetical protein
MTYQLKSHQGRNKHRFSPICPPSIMSAEKRTHQSERVLSLPPVNMSPMSFPQDYHIQAVPLCTVYSITITQLCNAAHKLFSLPPPFSALLALSLSVSLSPCMPLLYACRSCVVWVWEWTVASAFFINRHAFYSSLLWLRSWHKNLFIKHTHFQVFWEQTLWPPFYQLEVLDPLMVAVTQWLSLTQSSLHLESVQPFVEQPAQLRPRRLLLEAVCSGYVSKCSGDEKQMEGWIKQMGKECRGRKGKDKMYKMNKRLKNGG